MEQQLYVRKIGADEVPLIVALANEIWPVTYRSILSEDQIRYMMRLFYHPASLQKQMTESHHEFIVAMYRNQAVAFASFSSTSEAGIFKLQKIYVHPSMQGKGVGRCLIDYIIGALHLKHASALELNVNRLNDARVFYEKLGFSIIREEDIDIGNGYYMNDYVMRKTLHNKS